MRNIDCTDGINAIILFIMLLSIIRYISSSFVQPTYVNRRSFANLFDVIYNVKCLTSRSVGLAVGLLRIISTRHQLLNNNIKWDKKNDSSANNLRDITKLHQHTCGTGGFGDDRY